MKSHLPLSLLLASTLPLLAPAQTGVVPVAEADAAVTGRSAEKPSSADHQPLKKISRLNNKEIVLSRSLLERSATPSVRAFADDMVREHTAARERLDRIASDQGLSLGDDHVEQREKLEKKWSELEGAELDEDYVEAMIDGHEQMIEALEKAAKSETAALAAFASEELPKVKDHLARAKELKKTIDD